MTIHPSTQLLQSHVGSYFMKKDNRSFSYNFDILMMLQRYILSFEKCSFRLDLCLFTVKIDLNYTLLYINKDLFLYLCRCSHADALPYGGADGMGMT